MLTKFRAAALRRVTVNELSIDEFSDAIRETHGADAGLIDRVSVHKTFEGQTVWEGDVLVFTLHGHPTARRCYAWSVEGRVTAVLHEGPVDSPAAAVRAAIAAERCKHCGARLLPRDHACSHCGHTRR